MPKNNALLDALEIYKQPSRARSLRLQDLPPDMLSVIKIAAGDQPTISANMEQYGETEDHLRQAAVFYLQQTIAKSGNDLFRTLGLPAMASKDQVRTHKRWLLKWLHPDRNSSKWEATLFHRVSDAAETLENSAGPAVEAAPKPAEARTHRPSNRTGHKRAVSRGFRQPVRKLDWQGLKLRLMRRMLAVFIVALFGMFAAAVLFGPLKDYMRPESTGM